MSWQNLDLVPDSKHVHAEVQIHYLDLPDHYCVAFFVPPEAHPGLRCQHRHLNDVSLCDGFELRRVGL